MSPADSNQRPPHRDAPRVSGVSSLDEAAEAWVRRLQAGLSVEEEVEFAEWLQADCRHESSLRKYQAAWDRFAPLASAVQAGLRPESDQPVPGRASSPRARSGRSPRSRGRSRQTIYRWVVPALGLAAAITFALFLVQPRHGSPADAPLALPGLCEQRVLADGSVVELNRGTEIAVVFTEAERRVQLNHGEASFSVTENPRRPFIVAAGGVEVRAVGTAFNVRFTRESLEVVVTEGQVHLGSRAGGTAQVPTAVAATGAASEPPAGGALVSVGQSAVVHLSRSAPAPRVAALTAAEIEDRLAWQPKLLDFDDEPLSAIVAEFNRRNPVRLVVTDPVVANRRMTATFRSDNLEAFVRLLEANIGVQARRLGHSEIALVRK